MTWFVLACSQHFAGLPGGRVGELGLAPGGAGGQLIDGKCGRGFTAVV